jgi:hypothetical protein
LREPEKPFSFNISHGKIGLALAPIAQRIERCPPEAEACVRVAVGVLEFKSRVYNFLSGRKIYSSCIYAGVFLFHPSDLEILNYN